MFGPKKLDTKALNWMIFPHLQIIFRVEISSEVYLNFISKNGF